VVKVDTRSSATPEMRASAVVTYVVQGHSRSPAGPQTTTAGGGGANGYNNRESRV